MGYRRKKHTRRHVLRIAAILLIGFLVVGGVVYSVAYAPFLRVGSVTVTGAKTVLEADIRNAYIHFAQSSFIGRLLSPDRIFFWVWASAPVPASAISANLSSAVVHTDLWSRSVALAVEERDFFGIVCIDQGGCENFDHTGFVFAHAPDVYGALVFKITMEGKTLPPVGASLFSDSDWFGRMVTTLNQLKRAGIGIQSVRIRSQELREWEAVLSSGTLLQFSFNAVPEAVATTLNNLFEREKSHTLSYVDLRVPGRLYYR